MATPTVKVDTTQIDPSKVNLTKTEADVSLPQAQAAAKQALADLNAAQAAVDATTKTLQDLSIQAAPYDKIAAPPPQDLVRSAQAAKRAAVLARAKFQQQSVITQWVTSIATAKQDAANARAAGDVQTAALKEAAAQVFSDALKKIGGQEIKLKLPPEPAAPTSTSGLSGGSFAYGSVEAVKPRGQSMELAHIGRLNGLGLMATTAGTIKTTIKVNANGGIVATTPVATTAKELPAPTPAPVPTTTTTATDTGVIAKPATTAVPRTITNPAAIMNQQAKDLEEARKNYPSDPDKYGGKQGTPPSRWAHDSKVTVGLNDVQLNVLDWAPPPPNDSTMIVLAALTNIPEDQREQWFYDTYCLHSDPIGSGPNFDKPFDLHPQWVVDLQAGNLSRSGFVGFLQDVGDFVVDNAGTIAAVAAATVAVVAAVPTGGLTLAAIPAIVTAGAGAAATVTAIAKAAAPLTNELQDLTKKDSEKIGDYIPKADTPTATQYLQIQQAQKDTAAAATVPTDSTGQPVLFNDPTAPVVASVAPSSSLTLPLAAGGGVALLGLTYLLMRKHNKRNPS